MKIAIGSDHAGFTYKEKIIHHLKHLGHDVVDCGTHTNESCDYPVYIKPVASSVSLKQVDRGIVLGGSGNGEAIVANRFKGVRCTLCWNELSAKYGREHNDSNCLSLGQRMIAEDDLLKIVDVWLNTSFEGGRHTKRIQQIDE